LPPISTVKPLASSGSSVLSQRGYLWMDWRFLDAPPKKKPKNGFILINGSLLFDFLMLTNLGT
jgi:hypothetical protein